MPCPLAEGTSAVLQSTEFGLFLSKFSELNAFEKSFDVIEFLKLLRLLLRIKFGTYFINPIGGCIESNFLYVTSAHLLRFSSFNPI